jgi:hypothetical protein
MAACSSFPGRVDERLVGTWNCSINQQDFLANFRTIYDQDGAFYESGVYVYRMPRLREQFDIDGVSYTYKASGKWSVGDGETLSTNYLDETRLNVTIVPGLSSDKQVYLRSNIDKVMDSVTPDKKEWKWSILGVSPNSFEYVPQNGGTPRVICMR